MRLYYLFRCFIGKPRCFLILIDESTGFSGGAYAMCEYCDRQSEAHEFGGPETRYDLYERYTLKEN